MAASGMIQTGTRSAPDTRALDDIGTTVKVAGTTRDYSTTPVAQSSTGRDRQNDPPTLAVTGLAPSYNAGDAAVSLFSGCSISTIESGQMILELRLTVENPANGAIDPKTSETLVYSYTYVSQFDEESAPAPLSNQILWSPGQGHSPLRARGIVADPAHQPEAHLSVPDQRHRGDRPLSDRRDRQQHRHLRRRPGHDAAAGADPLAGLRHAARRPVGPRDHAERDHGRIRRPHALFLRAPGRTACRRNTP